MSEDLRGITIAAYNESAAELADYFRGIGPREKYIDYAIELAGSPEEPNILEIGCGDGRDASAIVQRTPNYLGTDVSVEAIKLARVHVPNGHFEVVDAVDLEFPERVEVILAFASVLHLTPDELRQLFGKAAAAQQPGDVFYISSKYKPQYTEEIKEDRFGKRLFYFYNAELIADFAGSAYKIANTWLETRGTTEWFELALQRA